MISLSLFLSFSTVGSSEKIIPMMKLCSLKNKVPIGSAKEEEGQRERERREMKSSYLFLF
jgi:hypothetical protein